MPLGVLFNTDRLARNEFLRYASRLDAMGYESLWLPELFTREPFATAGYLLAATANIKLATGIASVYARDPVATVSAASALQELSEGRFLLGLGVSNAPLAAARGHRWDNPVSKLHDYLHAMRQVQLTSPQVKAPVYLAAHGPRMLAVAAELADGANTYLMPPAHVTRARAALGQSAQLNTMLFCLVDDSAATARATARKAVAYYVGLDYYQRAWRSLGFTEADFVGGGSDSLIDSVVAWGSLESVRQRLQTQIEAGASRVVVIPLGRALGGQPDWGLLEALADNL